MRKVTKKAVELVKSCKSGTCSSNTKVEVYYGPLTTTINILLHGNTIFTRIINLHADGVRGPMIEDNFPYDGSYMYTRTTKERVRSIAREFNILLPKGY